MITLFFILMSLIIWHFIYEGIIAPTIRTELRHKLFALRDRIRLLKIENEEAFNDKTYDYFEDSINGSLKFQHLYSISVMFDLFKKMQTDTNLQEEIKRINELIIQCKVPGIESIVDEHFEIVKKAILINTGGWLIYFVPIFLIMGIYSKCTNLIKEITILPEKEVARFIPTNQLRLV